MYREEDYEKFAKGMEERFPKMFAGQYGGFACGPGWWPMLEKLCDMIQDHIDHSKGTCSQVVVEQIKEKFGSLRFYAQGGDDFTDGAITFAEILSGNMCEDCGAPGKRVSGGWIRTLCDFHIAEHEALRAEEMRKNGFEE